MSGHSKHEIADEILSEFLVIKDLYICGRMNDAICKSIDSIGASKLCTKEKLLEYRRLSASYRDDSVGEFINRRDKLSKIYNNIGPIALEIILDTTYDSFDFDLVNDMMEDYYGGVDTVAFADAYNDYSEDFNAFIAEYFI